MILVGLRDTRVGLVLLLGSLEIPLLAIGEKFNKNKEEDSAREDQVRKSEFLGCLVVCRDNKNVGWGSDKEEQEGLGQCYEAEVEDCENKVIVHFGTHDLPAVILGTDRVSSFAPVVESQADLSREYN